MKKIYANAKKNALLAAANHRILLLAIACSALYLGHLQPLHAQQIITATSALGFTQSAANYGQAPSAWSNVYLNLDAAPPSFANYRAPKIQFNTAKTSLGLRLGYRISPNLSLSSYYGKTNFGQPEAASFPTNNTFAHQFSHTRYGGFGGFGSASNFTNFSSFTTTHTGVDLTGNINLLKRITLFGRAGIASYTSPEIGNARFARLGLGLQYDINTRLGLRLEMERLRPLGPVKSAFGIDSGLDNYSLGAVFRF